MAISKARLEHVTESGKGDQCETASSQQETAGTCSLDRKRRATGAESLHTRIATPVFLMTMAVHISTRKHHGRLTTTCEISVSALNEELRAESGVLGCATGCNESRQIV